MATGRQCAVAALDSERYVSVTTLLACQHVHGGVMSTVTCRRGASCALLGVAEFAHLRKVDWAAVQEEEQTVACTLARPRSCLGHIPARYARRDEHHSAASEGTCETMQSSDHQACPEMLAPLGASTVSCSRPSATRLPNTVTMLSRRVADPCVATTVVLADRATCQITTFGWTCIGLPCHPGPSVQSQHAWVVQLCRASQLTHSPTDHLSIMARRRARGWCR